jgi:hypothetical protein
MYFRFCICFKFTVCTFVHLLCVWLYILNFNLLNIYETNFCCIFFLLFTTSSWEVRHLLNKSFSPTRNKSEKSFCSKKNLGKCQQQIELLMGMLKIWYSSTENKFKAKMFHRWMEYLIILWIVLTSFCFKLSSCFKICFISSCKSHLDI